MKNVSAEIPMKNASLRSVAAVTAALHVFHRVLKVACALGRPGGARRKKHGRTSVMRGVETKPTF